MKTFNSRLNIYPRKQSHWCWRRQQKKNHLVNGNSFFADEKNYRHHFSAFPAVICLCLHSGIPGDIGTDVCSSAVNKRYNYVLFVLVSLKGVGTKGLMFTCCKLGDPLWTVLNCYVRVLKNPFYGHWSLIFKKSILRGFHSFYWILGDVVSRITIVKKRNK